MMEIKAKVALSLPNTFYKVILKYDTFEKATFDSYLIATLVANAENEEEAIKYIDEITGNGSLNTHFKTLYSQIKEFSKEQIDGIINNSLFPITVIDQKNHFKYYPMFDATRMNNKVYDGNLRENEDLLIKLIMPKGNDIKFLSIDYIEEEGALKTDNYNAIFSDNMIKVNLDNGQYYEISRDNFELVHKNDFDNLGGFLGNVGNEITNDNWNVLSKPIIDTFSKGEMVYKDSCGNHSILYGDCIKIIDIICVFGLYFYKETKFDFSRKNITKCDDAIEFLLESKSINEYKTKSLIMLLSNASDINAQKAVQYILSRKDSKEISELGLRLIKGGLEKGWSHDVLLSIKKQVSYTDYKYLYRLDNNLDFTVEDFLEIDNAVLTENDKKEKQKYIERKDNLLNEINKIIGEIANSGIRESIKSLEKSELKSRVKKFVDKRIGHAQKDYKSLDMVSLKKEYDIIKSFYDSDYINILKEIKKED